MSDLEYIRSALKPHWKVYSEKDSAQLFGAWKPSVGERPDVFLDNIEFSIVLEVKAAEIVC